MWNRISLAIVLAVSFVFPPTAVFAKTGDVSTWLGTLYSGDGGDALQAYLDVPYGLAADATCNLFIADTRNNVIRRVDGATNVITTYAGTGHYRQKNGPAAKSEFRAPFDVVFDSDYRLLIAETESNAVRVIQNGSASTWLRNLHRPTGITHQAGTTYISDTNANKILAATYPSAALTTITNIATPGKIAYLDGSLYATSSEGTVLSRIDLTTGAVTTVLDQSSVDQLVVGSVTADAGLLYVAGVAGAKGIDNKIWKYNPTTGVLTELYSVIETEWYNGISDLVMCGGSMYTLHWGGSSLFRHGADALNPVRIVGKHRYADEDGPVATAQTGRPKTMVQSKDGNKIYVIENHRVKVYDVPTKTYSFVVGSPMDNFRDGAGDIGRVSAPTQMVISPDGTVIYIADKNNNRIRILTVATATLSTLTGAGETNEFDTNDYAEGAACSGVLETGVAGCAYFNRPQGIAVSKDGKKLYIADTKNNRIRTVNTTTGETAFLAGGDSGFRDGTGSAARFKNPLWLTLSPGGTKLYVVDQGNHAIREINLLNRMVKTIVGSGRPGYRDSSLRRGVMSYPEALVFGSTSNIMYVSEVGSQRIRIIDLKKKTISHLAGSGQRGSLNGSSRIATFNNPRGLMLLNRSTLLVADQLNDMIRAVSLR